MPLLNLTFSKGLIDSSNQEIPTNDFSTVYKNFCRLQLGGIKRRPALKNFVSLSYGNVDSLFYHEKSDSLIASVQILGQKLFYQISQNGSVQNITNDFLLGPKRTLTVFDGTDLIFSDENQAIRWDGINPTQSIPGFPQTKKLVYLDGYFLSLKPDSQEIQYAGPTYALRQTWSPLNFFQAEALFDEVRTIAVLYRELYVFGIHSVEIFQNVGASGLPFRRTFFLERGTYSPNSVTIADNTVWWLDSQRNFVKMQGRTPVIVSAAIENNLKSLNKVEDALAFTIEIDGSYFIVLNFPTDKKTFVYDFRFDEWYEWTSFYFADEIFFRLSSYVFVPRWNKHFAGDYFNGSIYELTFNEFKDDVGAIVSERRFSYDHGTSLKKRSNYYLFNVKQNVANSSVSEPKFMIRVNDDNAGWSEWVSESLGMPGDTLKQIYVPMRGIYRRRDLEIKCTDAVDFRLIRVEENVDIFSV